MRRKFAPRVAGIEAEWLALAESERKRFCEQVLESIGVARWTATSTRELVHSCPLPFGSHAHGDRNPSAALNWQKGLWNCLGCGSGGSMAWLIATCRDIGISQAHREIAALGPDGSDLQEILSFFDRLWAKREEIVSIPRYSVKVLEPWTRSIHPYLTEERRISPSQVARFLVGHDPTTNRIVIPHFWEGDLVGWQSRRLVDDGSPKYKNTPQFPKDETIFNYQRHTPETVVVESPMSVLVRSDHPDVEATFGASVTDRQVRLLSRHERVILAFDHDEAGWKATEDVGEALMAYTDVWVIGNRWNGDLADLSHEQFIEAFDASVPYAVWRRPAYLEALA